MPSFHKTTLWSNDPTRFDEVTQDVRFGQQGDTVAREPGRLHTMTAWGVPEKEIRELSAKHTDMVFFAEHRIELREEPWTKIKLVAYKAGKATEISL